jgi:hypothetical protein
MFVAAGAILLPAGWMSCPSLADQQDGPHWHVVDEPHIRSTSGSAHVPSKNGSVGL